MAWCSRLVVQRRSQRWLQLAGLGCLLGAVAIGIGLSCVVPDPEYCETRTTCPWDDTPLGPMQLICHPTLHVCLKTGPDICLTDNDCRVELPHCDLKTNACTPCRVGDASDTSCVRFTDRPLCGTASDGSGATLCLACRSNIDCPGSAPICDNQQCRKCTEHSDCEGELRCDDNVTCTDSLVCIGEGDATPELAGRCAQNGSLTGNGGKVVYVNNLDPICQAPWPFLDPPYGNELTKPQCTPQNAVTLAHTLGRRYIRLFGQDLLPLETWLKDGAAYSFIGAPRKGATNLATVSGRSTAFILSGTGSLTLDQLELLQKNPGVTLVSCSGDGTGPVPQLTVRRSVLHGTMTVGDSANTLSGAIMINSCNTLLDGNTIGVSTLAATLTDPAHWHGISIVNTNKDTSYLIQNNLIAGNMGVAMNLQGTGSARLVSRFNTLVRNGRKNPNRPGAVLCDALATGQELSHSIVWGNSHSTTDNSQFLSPSDCGVKNLIVGQEGLLMNNPTFIYADPNLDDNFQLLAPSPGIDKATPATDETFPTQDRLGSKRPQGLSWDIGATEHKP